MTIEPDGFVRSLIGLQNVPKAPTAQTGEKFGAIPVSFKMRGRGPTEYRIKCKKPAEVRR